MTTTPNQANFRDSLRAALTENPALYAPLRIEIPSHWGDDTGGLQHGIQPPLLELRYGNRTYKFHLEARGRSAPSVVRPALYQLQSLSILGSFPMLAVPYLSTTLVAMLEESTISAIDLNGNYFILTPELVAFRLDRPNKFPESKQIRNIYSGNSSIVGRFLLNEPGPFQQVNDIAAGIAALGGGISLPTISKVLSALTDDLIVQRSRSMIQLMQPRRLLEQLRSAYRPPRVRFTTRLKLSDDRSATETLLNETLGVNKWIWSGESSAESYAFTTPTLRPIAYTRVGLDQLSSLRRYEDARFYTCELRQTNDEFVYFGHNGTWASRIECYLALWQFDKREREIATDIESIILKGIQSNA